MIVEGANPARSVSTWAPTAWPPDFRSFSSSRTMSSRATGSWHQTGSGAIIAATLLPSAPRSTSWRTLTGTIAFSSRPSVSGARAGAGGAPSAPATVASTTSLTVPPSESLIALMSRRLARTQVKRRCGPIGWL